MTEGEMTGRERVKPAIQKFQSLETKPGLCRFSHQLTLMPKMLTVSPFRRPTSPLGCWTPSVWASGSLLQWFSFHANILLLQVLWSSGERQ